MQRHHRDLLTAIVAIMFLMLGLLGWGALSRARQGPTMVVAEPGRGVAPASSAPIPHKSLPVPSSSVVERPATAPATVRIHIVGAVRKPAVYTLVGNTRVDDAVTKAGGATADADLERINLADFLKDGEQVRIPRKSDRPPAAALAAVPRAARPSQPPPSAPSPPSYRSSARYPLDDSAASHAATGKSGAAEAAAPVATPAAAAGGKVNLNTANAAELDTLPGVGPATAAAILDYRRQHGRFLRIEDILEVRGIGEKRFENMKERLTVK